MVRLKVRWLRIRIDYLNAIGIDDKNDNVDKTIPSKNVLARSIRDNFIQCSGIAMSGVALDVQVRLYDGKMRMALIRVPREYCQALRASMTLLTQLKSQRIAISVLCVSGSARTAKIDALKTTRQYYNEQLRTLVHNYENERHVATSSRTEIDLVCQSMEETLHNVLNIEH